MKALKYLFAILLIVVIWGLWWWLDLPLWLAIVATAIVVLVLALVIIWGIVEARRAASQIEKALAKQAKVQAARPDVEADVNAMASEFNKAVGTLKSKLGKAALYDLPWYVIIGPPGVGKTTALRKSGLIDHGEGSVKGLGGTRNCDWWMTKNAIIIDTAGRYTTEDADRDEWLAFLDLVQEARPKRPINGILLAVSAIEVAHANEQELNAISTKIRARIDEVTAHLEMSLPIYVLFTKCDLLSGFVEMYSEMGKTERQQIWGFTLPVAAADADVVPARAFFEQFDRLAERTERRAFKRMGDERRIEARGMIYQFPQNFESLRENLASFINRVFSAHPYAEAPMLRGCYFTSGTQEGRPIDRLMGSMAQAFGVPSNAILGDQQLETRSYFLGDVFNKVVFVDRELARRSAKHVRKSTIMKWAGAGGIFATAVGLCVLPIRSMQVNEDMLARVSVAVDEIEKHENEDEAVVASAERLWPLHEAQAELYGYEHDSRPLELRWGMYQGDGVQQPTRTLFGRAVREELIVPLMSARTAELQEFAGRYSGDHHEPPAGEAKKAFEGLRAYLLLSGNYEEYRPGLPAELIASERAAEDTWLADHVARSWARALSLDTETPGLGKMETIARAYVAVLRENHELLLERDDAMVEEVRRVLRRADGTEASLAELIAAASEVDGVRDLTLASMKLGTDVYKNNGIRIRAAFTRQGWEKYVRSYLARSPGEFVGAEWVLGLADHQARERQAAARRELRTRYFEQYINEWDQFVARIYVDTSTDLVDSLTMFQDLARGGTPLRVLLTNVAWHTNLEEVMPAEGEIPWYAAPQLTGGIAEGPEGTVSIYFESRDVQRHFEPFVEFGVNVEAAAEPEGSPPPVAGVLPLDKYHEQLALVRDALQAAVDNRAQFDTLAKKLETATQVVKSQVSEQQEPWRSRFDLILRPPFDALHGVVEDDQKVVLGDSWCSSVYQPFAEQVAEKYPFNPRGYDLPLGEFAAWFAPEQGPVWEFYAAKLATPIVRNGAAFTIPPAGEAQKIEYNAHLPDFLAQYTDIGTVMFPPGSEKPKFEFDVRIEGTEGVAEITLTVDGQTVSYRNGPLEWKSLVWPGEGEPGASIKTKGIGKSGDVIRSGDWGFWRLLAEATVRGGAGQQVYVVRWDLSDQQIGVITIWLRPKRENTPLFGVPARGSSEFLKLFSSLQVPAFVVHGHSCEVSGGVGRLANRL